jgi:long-chain acyl-CoA synthetase
MSPASEAFLDVVAAADPVGAFFAAHQRGELFALRTSGTSGNPRSVVRTTGSWVASFEHVGALAGIDATSRVWVPGPLSSTMNLFAVTQARFVAAAVIATADGMTHAHLTPSALAGCLDSGVDLREVTVVVAGDRLPATLCQRALDAGARVCHYYGAAELSFVAWGTHAADLAPFPGVEVSLRDDEIWVRSPYLCQGYDGPPGPMRADADGFATVGDRGSYVDGRLHVTGRSDAVTSGGATVQVADVEDHLRVGARGDVVVLGIPHPRLGAVISVVLTDASDHRTVQHRAREGLPAVQRPRIWFHVPDLPLTDSGKLDRQALLGVVTSPGARRLV